MDDLKAAMIFFAVMVEIIGSEVGKLIPDHHQGML